MCASECMGLGRIERRVNAAEDDVGAARTRELSDFVATQRIRRYGSRYPTTSPGASCAASKGSSVSSATIGSPHREGVAAASTYSHRGVMTAVPNDT